MAEIDNEADGGDSPATLKSAMESLKGGYDPCPGFPVAKVKKELAALIAKHGNARADRFVTDADFAARKKLTQAEAGIRKPRRHRRRKPRRNGQGKPTHSRRPWRFVATALPYVIGTSLAS